MNRITKLLIAFGLLAALSFGQVTMTSTTTSALIPGNSPGGTVTCFTVASATGMVAPNFSTPNQPTGNQSMLFIDKEAILVTQVNGTYVCGLRGYNQTRVGIHASGATVWVGPPAAFNNVDAPGGGGCLRTALLYVPYINTATGNTFDCLGVTTAGKWVQTNAPGVPVFGSTVTPATSITPTGTLFATTSGATTIATIVVPAGWKAGMCLGIIPGGTGATTSSGGNIGLTSSAFVVGRVNTFCWSGSLWYPSYVS